MTKTSECYLCGLKYNKCEGSVYREDPKQEEPTGTVCANCANA